MALKDTLDADMKTAMREKDAPRLSAIRMLKSAIKYREIEVMKPLDDAGVLAVIGSEIKRRRDSVEQYRAGTERTSPTRKRRRSTSSTATCRRSSARTSRGRRWTRRDREGRGEGAEGHGAVMKALLPEVQGRAEGKARSATW